MAKDGIDAGLNEFGVGKWSGVRSSVRAESADARNADECTQQNQERTDRDSDRIENGGVEKRSENERRDGK